MAQRYGGKYSPHGDAPDGDRPAGAERGAFDGARIDPVGPAANALFLPPVLLVFLSIFGGATELALGLLAAALLAGGAFLLRDGLRAEAAYNARKVASRPAFPRKIVAAISTGAGAAVAAYANEAGLVAPLIYGAAAMVLHLTAFGIDPMKNKGMEGIDSFQQSRVATAVSEGEAYLDGMTDAIRRARDPRMEARVERFQTSARELFRTVDEDPRDLTSARKYLTVYLRGARDATVKYADIYSTTRDADARADYAALLDDLEENFIARTRKMLTDDRSDLTVEIEVLRDRLKREGVNLN